MSTEDYHFMREDRLVHWRRIAAYLADHPWEFEIPLANIKRWMAGGRVHPAPLMLAADNHDAELIKSCSPFVGFSKIAAYP
ncbi:MAG: hypothetical protein ACK49N_07755 [Verrucomicrobiota bacterium]